MIESAREEILLSVPRLDAHIEDLSQIIGKTLKVRAQVKVLTADMPETLRRAMPRHIEVRTRDKVFGAGLVTDQRHTLIMLPGTGLAEGFLGIYSSHAIFADMASAYFASLWADSRPA